MKLINLTMTALLFTMFNIQVAQARDFRSLIKIPVAPQNIALNSTINKKTFRPVDSALIEKHVRKIVSSWNRNDLSKYLSDTFQDKTLLINTIRRTVPRDASLRLLSVQGISTLQQSWDTNKARKKTLNSVVIATVDIQLEFNDPFQGLVKLPHTSQFYLQVTESE